MSLLDIYYFIDNNSTIDNSIDNTLLHNAIKWYLDKKLTEFTINKFEHIPLILPNEDTLVKSFIYMKMLFDKLKLKTTNTTWFLYISSGNIKGFDKETSLILLNKVPSEAVYQYNLSKTIYKICVNDDKNKRDKKISQFVQVLHETIHSKKTIRAPNLN